MKKFRVEIVATQNMAVKVAQNVIEFLIWVCKLPHYSSQNKLQMEAISIPLPGGSATARCRSMNRLEDHI
jgi:hypothetical protein